MFQDATTQKILGLDELAQLYGLDPAQIEDATDSSIVFSGINWNANGSSVIFESRGLAQKPTLWIGSPDGMQFKKINLPFDQFSDIFGYKISANDQILFAAIPQGESGQGEGPTNLYSFSLKGGDAPRKITNYTGNTYVGNFDYMPAGDIIYETITFAAPDSQPSYSSALWLANADGTIIRQLLDNTNVQFGIQDASPNGQIVGIYQNHVAILNMSRQMPITFKSYNGTITDAYPKFSEDGRYIVYWHLQSEPSAADDNGNKAAGRQTGTLTLRIASTDGTVDEAIYSRNGFPQGGQLAPVGISPDGRFIAYEISFDKQSSYNNDTNAAGIYMVNLQTVRIPEFSSGISSVQLPIWQVQSIVIVTTLSFTVMIALWKYRSKFS